MMLPEYLTQQFEPHDKPMGYRGIAAAAAIWPKSALPLAIYVHDMQSFHTVNGRKIEFGMTSVPTADGC